MSNFGNSCKETQIFSNFDPENPNTWQVLSRKCQNHGTFNVEISLAKGVNFTKIGLANGTILKLLAAHPYPKFSQELPPPVLVSLFHEAQITPKLSNIS